MPINNVNVGTAPDNGTGESLRLGGQKINANFAYLKTYIDNLLQGLKWKQRVNVATTANITLSGEQTIDGVLTNASRILVKDQTTAPQNGIYTTGAGAWVRTLDADEGTELVNATVSVVSGTVNANTNWTCNVESITIGTTDIEWVNFSNISSGVSFEQLQIAVQDLEDELRAGYAGSMQDLFNAIQAVEPELTAQAITDALGHEVADAANLLTPVPLNALFTDTVYTHPATHPPSIIVQDANNRFVTDAEKETWNSGTGGAAVANRPIKYISASTPYTLVPTDFTDDKLVFTADAGETIQVVLDAGVTPANGELMLISGGNNFLVPTAGAGAGLPTYSIAITTPTEGQVFTEGDSIALTSTITETPAAGSVEFIFPENTNPTTTGLNAWIGGVVLSTDKVSWNGNFESTEVIQTFTDIAENEYGTHPAFTDQHTLNAWLLGNSTSGGATTLNSPTNLSVSNNPADANTINWLDTNS